MAKRKIKKLSHPLRILTLLGAFLIAIFAYPRIIQPSCANTLSCSESFKFEIQNNEVGIFGNRKVIPPKISDAALRESKQVLGESVSPEEKHIYVDLTNQKLYAYEGKRLFFETLVSTGKWHPTPTGDFTIWSKVRSTRMSGGSGDDYYNLPNVPFVMFFSNDSVPQGAGFSFHGAYWHDNFGHAMSHGCVNLREEDAQKLYEWATPVATGNTTLASSTNPGTKVTIYGEAP